jgi:hypothetical protein
MKNRSLSLAAAARVSLIIIIKSQTVGAIVSPTRVRLSRAVRIQYVTHLILNRLRLA